jgi:nicotinamide-nucleotide amidase
MNVEVINTGTELLLGHTINTHLAFLAGELFSLGLRITRQVCVPDGMAIRDALDEAMNRAEIVILTGGLGPTTDDVTREITAGLLGLPLRHDETVMEQIAERFQRRALPMTERNKRQAQVPEGATVLHNPNGTAPGLYLRPERGGRVVHLFLLPGPPRELRPMVTEQAIPILRGILPGGEKRECRSFRISGMGESQVEALVGAELEALPGMELGYCARPGEVDVRCIGEKEVLAHAGKIIRDRLGEHVSSYDGKPIEEEVVRRLTELGRTLSLAESCTGGFVGHRITNIPGASNVLIADYVTYANEAKVRALDVDPGLIGKHGAVSADVASAMAEGARRAAGADYGLSLTGIAGPGGGTPAKPVGTVFLALASAKAVTRVMEHHFPTDRETFKWLASQAALDLLLRAIR